MPGRKRTQSTKKKKPRGKAKQSRAAKVTADKKKLFLEIYAETYGNVTQTCRLTKVGRSTFYEWSEKDPEFKKAVERVEPSKMIADRAVNGILQLIDAGNVAAIIYTLKCHGRELGWVEDEVTAAEDRLKVYVNVNTDKI